jgi:SAM-dependent methyltransferase
MNSRNSGKAKVLVAITNYGSKNQYFLERLLAEYQSMERYDVDIVVLSNIPKYFGPHVEVMVGLPIADPWSLPFGYKDLFADLINKYDLFIYTEDDTLITERNIDAFVEETRILPEKFIAGFMRFEVWPDGRRAYPDMHSHYHWEQESVKKFKNSMFAYYTNEHAACFILTSEQLRKAIDSGGFMLPPRKGLYDMLVTAATEPYTDCGMKKLICISRLDDFLVHHLPNVYLNSLGIDGEHGKIEIKRLESFASGRLNSPLGPLFEPYPLRDGDGWNKKYYEAQRDDVLKRVPRDARRILSVGCGCGTTEEALVKLGIEVVGIPLNPIICALAEMKGITMLPPDFDLAAKKLEGQQFDCILVLDILQQLRDPVAILSSYREHLREGGTMLISVSNWNFLGILRKRLFSEGRANFECRSSAGSAGVHRTTSSCVENWLIRSGFREIKQRGVAEVRFDRISRWTFGLVDGVLCRKLLISAER